MLAACNASSGGGSQLTGRVVDASGRGVGAALVALTTSSVPAGTPSAPGAVVMELTVASTISGLDGSFTLQLPPASPQLVKLAKGNGNNLNTTINAMRPGYVGAWSLPLRLRGTTLVPDKANSGPITIKPVGHG